VSGTLITKRLRQQQLVGSKRRTPQDVVASLCAMQAQDYPAAKWAIGLRSPGMQDADVEQAFNDGLILRTHVLRPTWHFVSPDDIRWLLTVSAPRIHAASASYYRQAGLDAKIVNKACALMHRVLEGGQTLTRVELGTHLLRAKIPAQGLALAYVVMHAEVEGVICSGPRRGKQFTYALLSERAPNARVLDRETALGELAYRYFASHGPATVRDFAWWSSLTMTEAQRAIASASRPLESTKLDGKLYWNGADAVSASKGAQALLLPNYDEYVIAYKDRGVVLDSTQTANMVARSNGAFANHVAIDGRLAGSWSRTIKPTEVLVEVSPYRKLTPAHTRAIAAAADCYGEFLGLTADLSIL
jgi:hypothetical protein